MELEQALRRRRMVRAYDAIRPVPSDALDAVLAAALRSPSAGFTQATSFLVLATAEQRETYWRLTAQGTSRWLRGMQTAPVLVLVWTSQEAYLDRYAEPDKGCTDRDLAHWVAPYWYVDAGMASMAALLSVVDQDLGACFFGIPPDRVDSVRETYGVPPEQLSVGVISLGYPDPAEAPSGSPRGRVRRPPADFIHTGTW
jgi:nitroreductase